MESANRLFLLGVCFSNFLLAHGGAQLDEMVTDVNVPVSGSIPGPSVGSRAFDIITVACSSWAASPGTAPPPATPPRTAPQAPRLERVPDGTQQRRNSVASVPDLLRVNRELSQVGNSDTFALGSGGATIMNTKINLIQGANGPTLTLATGLNTDFNSLIRGPDGSVNINTRNTSTGETHRVVTGMKDGKLMIGFDGISNEARGRLANDAKNADNQIQGLKDQLKGLNERAVPQFASTEANNFNSAKTRLQKSIERLESSRDALMKAANGIDEKSATQAQNALRESATEGKAAGEGATEATQKLEAAQTAPQLADAKNDTPAAAGGGPNGGNGSTGGGASAGGARAAFKR